MSKIKRERPPVETARKRTRTGCLTCRKRRIKCDEAKPECANCSKTRRFCEGYGPKTDHQAAYFRPRNPPPADYVVPYQPYLPFRPTVHPDQLLAASNYFAATGGAPYPDPVLYTPVAYMPIPMAPIGYVQGSVPVYVDYPHEYTCMPIQMCSSLTPDAEMPVADAPEEPADTDLPPGVFDTLFSAPSAQPQSQTDLTNYVPDGTRSPLMHADAQRMFRHFVHGIAHQVSLFERHGPRPEQMVIGSTEPASTNIWTYDVPMMAISCPALLHAILALSALHISTSPGASAASAASHHHASLLHYHLAIRKLASALRHRRADQPVELAIFATSLVLAFYETMTGEHDKWARHLEGSSVLVQDFDMLAFRQDYELEISAVKHETAAERAQANMRKHRKADAVIRLDLMYFYLRMDVMRSLASDVPPCAASGFWADVPSRHADDPALAHWDATLKLAVVAVDWIARESARKRAPHDAVTEYASLGEWESLHARVVALQAGFERDCVAQEVPDGSVFGGTRRYERASASCVCMYICMLETLLLRNRPVWTGQPSFKGGLQNIFIPMVAERTAPLGEQVCRCIQWLRFGNDARESGAFVALTMPLMYAAAQFGSQDKRAWVEAVLDEAFARTGWRTALVIKNGLGRLWSFRPTPAA